MEDHRKCMRLNSGETSHSYALETWPRCRCGLIEAPETLELLRPGGPRVIETKTLLMQERATP
jgi:hypothetical protein